MRLSNLLEGRHTPALGVIERLPRGSRGRYVSATGVFRLLRGQVVEGMSQKHLRACRAGGESLEVGARR